MLVELGGQIVKHRCGIGLGDVGERQSAQQHSMTVESGLLGNAIEVRAKLVAERFIGEDL